MILYWYPVSSAHTQLVRFWVNYECSRNSWNNHCSDQNIQTWKLSQFFPGGFDFSSICPSLVLFEVFLGSLEILIQTNPKYVLCDFFFLNLDFVTSSVNIHPSIFSFTYQVQALSLSQLWLGTKQGAPWTGCHSITGITKRETTIPSHIHTIWNHQLT